MSDFGRISEERIRKAQEEGKFDQLPGRGKPLKLDENPFEPEELRTAFHLLKQNDFTLPWIAAWQDIERALEAARTRLREAHQRQSSGLAWDAARAEFAAEVTRLNGLILEYNLSVPSTVFQKPSLSLEREIKAALAA